MAYFFGPPCIFYISFLCYLSLFLIATLWFIKVNILMCLKRGPPAACIVVYDVKFVTKAVVLPHSLSVFLSDA